MRTGCASVGSGALDLERHRHLQDQVVVALDSLLRQLMLRMMGMLIAMLAERGGAMVKMAPRDRELGHRVANGRQASSAGDPTAGAQEHGGLEGQMEAITATPS